MSPPPSADLPLTQRIMALAQTLQFAWFVGHVSLLLCTIRYSLSYITFNYNSRMAAFTYRTAFISAAVTYGIVVYKAFRARARQAKSGQQAQQAQIGMIADENVHYLIMAFIWLFSKQIPLAILPFSVYSVFHVATYTRSNLLPTLQPQPQAQQNQASGAAGANAVKAQSALSESIGRFVKDYYDMSMTLVAMLEIALWFRLLGSAILFQKGSWIQLIIYTIFFRVRHSQSNFVQHAITNLVARADAQLANQSTPPAVRQVWEQVKSTVRAGAEATDVNRFVRQAQAQPKKAQ